jgi:WD40 repeat protein
LLISSNVTGFSRSNPPNVSITPATTYEQPLDPWATVSSRATSILDNTIRQGNPNDMLQRAYDVDHERISGKREGLSPPTGSLSKISGQAVDAGSSSTSDGSAAAMDVVIRPPASLLNSFDNRLSDPEVGDLSYYDDPELSKPTVFAPSSYSRSQSLGGMDFNGSELPTLTTGGGRRIEELQDPTLDEPSTVAINRSLLPFRSLGQFKIGYQDFYVDRGVLDVRFCPGGLQFVILRSRIPIRLVPVFPLSIHDASTGRQITTVAKLEVGPVKLLAMKSAWASSRKAAIAGRSGRFEIRALPNWAPLISSWSDAGEIVAMAFWPKSDHILAVATEYVIRLWRVQNSGNSIQAIDTLAVSQNKEAFVHIEFSKDGQFFGALRPHSFTLCSFDVDTATWSVRRELELSGSSKHSFRFSSDGERIAVSGTSDTIRVYDWFTKEMIWESDQAPPLSHWRFSSDGEVLALVSHRKVEFRDWSARLLGKIEFHYSTSPEWVQISPTGHHILVASRADGLTMWEKVL